MITRRAPFEGDSVEALRAAIGAAPPAISEMRPGVPPQLARIVGTCLEPDPTVRWQSAQDLLARLKDLAERGGPRNQPRAPAAQRKWAWSALGIAACATVLAAGVLYRHNATTGALDSIAVLPLVNESRASETEYMADGITEAIINRLSDARGLKVIARATVFLFKGQVVDPQKVGRQLGVGAVAMGKLTQRGDSLVVQIELVRVADGSELWGDHFQRSIGDIQALNGDIAGEIAEKLRLRLAGDAIKRMTRRDTANSEAYQLYLKAMYLLEDSLRN
jgi:TolB-like protein